MLFFVKDSFLMGISWLQTIGLRDVLWHVFSTAADLLALLQSDAQDVELKYTT